MINQFETYRKNDLSKLGYEGIAVRPLEKDRCNSISLILQDLDDFYPKKVML